MPLMEDVAERARELLRERLGRLSLHFKRVFMPDGVLTRDAEIVLADFRHACFWDRTTWHADNNVMREREALRRLYLRMTRLLELDDQSVRKLVEIDYGD